MNDLVGILGNSTHRSRRDTLIIRTTTDPITGREVADPELHPRVHEGNGDNGLEIYFENEANRQACLNMELEGNIALKGDDSDVYIAEA